MLFSYIYFNYFKIYRFATSRNICYTYKNTPFQLFIGGLNMSKFIKNILNIILPVISIFIAYFLLKTKIRIIYFHGYCSLLNDRTLITHFSKCGTGYSETPDMMFKDIYILFILYLICIINLYFYKKRLKKFGNSDNI